MGEYNSYKKDYYDKDYLSESYKRHGNTHYREDKRYYNDRYRQRRTDTYDRDHNTHVTREYSPESTDRKYRKIYENSHEHPHMSTHLYSKQREEQHESSDTDTSGYSRHKGSEKHMSHDRSNNSISNENDKYTTIIVRSLDPQITEEDVENAISDLAIQNGFSLPNLVNLKTLPNSAISNPMYFGADNSTHALHMSNGHTYTFGFEKIALVTFPSPSAATRFMGSVKSRMLKISDKNYYVEFDTSNTDVTQSSSLNQGNDSSVPDINEIASLLQKRKVQSDWNCPSCRFLNFSRRTACLSCGIPKPPDSVLEGQNIATGIAAMNQAQMLQSNISDVSTWIILKNIPGHADPAKLILQVLKIVPDSPQQLQRCTYVIDPNSETKRGFIFLHFLSSSPVEKYIANRGDKKSELVKLDEYYHRIDTVRAREKHVAEELFRKLKFNSIKIFYEFNTLTLETTLLSENYTKMSNHKEHHSFKIKTTDVTALELIANSNDAPSMALNYLSNWISDSIWIPTGKPNTASFVYDPSTDYFFDHNLSLYYDAASGYYMSLTGNYYIWDEQSTSLKIVNSNDNVNPAHGSIEESGSNMQKADAPSNISGVLEAAMKVAQVSKENTQQMSSVIEKKKDSVSVKRSTLDFGKTFTRDSASDDECDMELDDKSDEESPKNTYPQKISQEASQKDAAIQKPKIKTLNVCFVCIRTFDTDEALHIHERDSKYHQALLSLARA